MARRIFLDYVWKNCVEPQINYSFSLNHTIPYSVIAVQEMNLATRWNPLYWSCACLCINAGNTETGFEEDDDEEQDEEEKKTKSGAPSYGKISKALTDCRLHGVNIEFPNINTSQADFVPDIENNSILYSLKTVTNVSDDLYSQIIQNRPYSSIEDFCSKVSVTPAQMSSLIKAGCFNSLYKMSRRAILYAYFNYLANQEIILKKTLNLSHLKKALSLGEKFPGYEDKIQLLYFKAYIDKNQKLDPSKEAFSLNALLNKKCYKLTEESCISFFNMKVAPSLDLRKGDYDYLDGHTILLKASSFTKFYDAQMKELTDYLNSEQGKLAFQKMEKDAFIKDLIEKYAEGTEADWDMQTMNFYQSEHALARMSEIKYNIKDFNKLPEIPITRKYIGKDGEEKETAETCAICGTVVDANNVKHVVSLLTKYGVVNVKLFSQAYSNFSQKISIVEDAAKKKKTVLDDSWFKRGTKLIIHGFRRENMFVAKTEYVNKVPKMVGLIESLDTNGNASIRYTRKKKISQE